MKIFNPTEALTFLFKSSMFLCFALLCNIAIGQDQIEIEMNSDIDNVQLSIIETQNDFARIQFQNSFLGISDNFGRWQIAANGYGNEGDPTKAMNFFFSPNQTGAGKNVLSLRDNGQVVLGSSFWQTDDDGVIRTNPDDVNGDLYLISNDAVIINLNEDNNADLGTFYIRNGNGVDAVIVDEAGNMTITGTLTQGSDINRKENFEAVNFKEILDKVINLDIVKWNYINEEITHLGPMAQDFHQAFGLGGTDKGISAVDADGIALAAIIALSMQNEELKDRITKLESLISEQ